MDFEVVDFHLHLPWRYSDPVDAAKELLRAMDEANVRLGVLIAVDVSLSRIQEHIRPDSVRRAVSDAMDYLVLSGPPQLEELILKVLNGSEGVEELKSILIKHIRPNSHVAAAARASGGRLLPVASYNPDVDPREFTASLRREGFIGVKLYPTLNFCRPSSRRLKPIYDYLSENELILIVHTGCDPGVWELPRFCQYARPRELAGVAREYPDLRIVMAHMGAYGALQPGIFFDEAIEVMSRYDNIYADTSAVDTFYIELAVERLGYDRLLFGSDYPYVVGLNITDSVYSIVKLGFEDRVVKSILRDNALRLLGHLIPARSPPGEEDGG